ncbi:MAG: transposase [Proteobacteria bacterium]|nr:transposase [Pseudomonadota bacterium]
MSNFREWGKYINPEALIFPENFGSRMSIDEVSLHNDEFYTVITNKDAHGRKGSLAGLIKGTKNEIVSKALNEVPAKKLMEVQEITADLANSMDWICRTNFLNARITADRFHAQKIVSEALQEIRIKYRRQAIDEENELQKRAGKNKIHDEPEIYDNFDTKKQLLARSRYLLFKPKNKWTESQKERAAILFEVYPELKKAYDLSMWFRGIYEYSKTLDMAKKRMEEWFLKVNESKIQTLISASKTIENNMGKIMNYFWSRETNASAESFNAKLKGFRSLVRGVNDIKFFLFRITTFYA